jgi:hypothetical protein
VDESWEEAMSQADQLLCRRIAQVTHRKKLPERRRARIESIVRSRAAEGTGRGDEGPARPRNWQDGVR